MYEDLKKIQNELSRKVVLSKLKSEIKVVAGIDISVDRYTNIGYCAIILLDRDLKTLEEASFVDEIKIPYVPGFLSFRELPIIEKCFSTLKSKPDLVFIDGQGIAHPRGFGIASHFGITYNIPTIGCAKSLLVGIYEDPDNLKGSFSPIIYKAKIVGSALRTKPNTKPIFVSPGHMVTVEQSIMLTLSFTDKYRVPEPTRRADILSKRLRRLNDPKLKKQ
ncbi:MULTISPECIES: endonuclease V [Calditerrivibrio]|uniref:Endonuclease V n=1 Tax=Calditerrivibrio nitroreducens TaxID=477976 RepID=A0A2J6WG57_9BACT|nr:MAG: endonuclease V [Calditerrivibrio nitroreducens]